MTLFYIFIQNREHTNTVAKKDEYIISYILYVLSNINAENRLNPLCVLTDGFISSPPRVVAGSSELGSADRPEADGIVSGFRRCRIHTRSVLPRDAARIVHPVNIIIISSSSSSRAGDYRVERVKTSNQGN